jgi:predicted Zn-dependent peptidase
MLWKSSKSLEKFKLKNGVEVIHLKYPEMVSALAVVYNVGSANEGIGKTGSAHLLEHLMFNGTKNFAPFSLYIDSFGGSDNAFTDKDITVYHSVFPAEKLGDVLRLEADRMENLDFSGFDVEKEVILNEYFMSEDEDDELWTETFAHLMPESSYSHPVIGWEWDIRNLELEDVREFYERFYSIENVFLVILSPFETREIYNILDETFGRVEKRGEKADFRITELNQNHKVEVFLKGRNLPKRFIISWRLPRKDLRFNVSLNIFSRILDLDRTSPLWSLVEDGEIEEYAVRLYEYKVGNVFCVIGEYDTERSPNFERIYKIVENFEAKEEVFLRVKKMLKSEILNSFDEAENLAINYALNYSLFNFLGGLEDLVRVVDEVEMGDVLEIPKILRNSLRVLVSR